MRERAVILGGGPCGLSAAWEFARRGVPVTVVEAQSKLGGLCATTEYQGFRFDLGGHRFISRNRELVQRIQGLLGDDLLMGERRSVIVLNGKTFHYPLSVLDLVRKNPLAVNLRALGDYLYRRARCRLSPRPETSFEEWVVNHFGRPLYDLFFGPYTQKLWGLPPSSISADWAAERISLFDLADVLRHLLGRGREIPRTYAPTFLYPKWGMGQIFDAMGREVERLGGTLYLQTKVKAVEREGWEIRRVWIETGGELFVVEGSWFVSTIPLPDLFDLFLPPVPGDFDLAPHSLVYRAMRFLNIPLDQEEVSPYTWIYVADPGALMTRIQEPKRRSPFNAPAGKSSLMLEIPCWIGDETWRAPDDRLLARGLESLERIGFPLRGSVIHAFSTRATHAYPVYSLTYRELRERLLRALDRIPNLMSVGRQGAFRYLFMDGAMEMGILAARRLLGESLKREEVLGVGEEKNLLEIQSVAAEEWVGSAARQ
ncbi:MAG: FAD-dependent oxidoreductase [Candidatus Methylomirabilales bacterium]